MRFPRATLLTLAALSAAASLIGPTAEAQTALDLKIAVQPNLIELKPGGIANVTVILHNPTTRTLALELAAQPQNATPTVNVSFGERTVRLAPNETRSVQAAVKAQPRSLSGDQPIVFGAHEMLTTPTTTAADRSTLASATARLAVHILAAPQATATPKPAAVGSIMPTPSPPPAGAAQTALVVAGGAAAMGGAAWSFSWMRRNGGWLALFAPLYTRLAPHKILDQPTRKRVADLVLAEPGITFGEAQRKLGIGAGALTHHARMLEQNGILFSSPDGQTRRFFPVGGGYVAPVASLAERALAELRREPATLSALAARLGVTKQALHYHVKKLISEGKLRPEGDRLLVGPSASSSASS